jgi:hypothetical protein
MLRCWRRWYAPQFVVCNINGDVQWLMPSHKIFAHPGLCYMAVMAMVVFNVGDTGNSLTS